MGRVVCPLHHGNHGGLFCTIICHSTADVQYKQRYDIGIVAVYCVFRTCMYLTMSGQIESLWDEFIMLHIVLS